MSYSPMMQNVYRQRTKLIARSKAEGRAATTSSTPTVVVHTCLQCEN